MRLTLPVAIALLSGSGKADCCTPMLPPLSLPLTTTPAEVGPPAPGTPRLPSPKILPPDTAPPPPPTRPITTEASFKEVFDWVGTVTCKRKKKDFFNTNNCVLWRQSPRWD